VGLPFALVSFGFHGKWAKGSKHHITHGKGNHNEHYVGVMQQSFAVCFNLCRGCQGLNQKILLFYAACIVYAAKVYLLCGIKCSILAAFGQPAGWQICLLNPLQGFQPPDSRHFK